MQKSVDFLDIYFVIHLKNVLIQENAVLPVHRNFQRLD